MFFKHASLVSKLLLHNLLIERISLNNKLHICKPGTLSFLNRFNTISISVCLQGLTDYVDSLRYFNTSRTNFSE